MTLRDMISEAIGRLNAAGVDDARQDAWILLAHACRQDRANLMAHALDEVQERDALAFRSLVDRRERREPLAQIVGVKEFWSLDFDVTSDVLCPRPDSETLIETALAAIRERAEPSRWAGRILDLGTGSGCLLLSLLSELPNASGIGIDRSQRALSIARSNGQRLGLAERVSWLCSDWGTALDTGFDLIISNPPYIADAEMGDLALEIREFEPEAALIGGQDGLDAYRAIGQDLHRLLKPDALVCLEIGVGQADAIEALLLQNRVQPIDRRLDLGGIERCLIARPC